MLRASFSLALIFTNIVALGQETRGVGYPTVAAALEALRTRSDVKISEQGGWTIVQDPSNSAIWSFTPSDHPAHPAVVKRTVVESNGAIGVQMNALCQASKLACDKLVADFQQLNDKMRESMQANARTPQSDIQTERVGDDSFRITLKSFRSNTIDAAQVEITPKAQQLCGNQPMGFGRYDFELSQPLSSEAAQKRPFVLKQEVICGVFNPPPPIVSTQNTDTTWRPSDAEAQTVERQMHAYFSARDGARYQDAYSFFSPSQKQTISFNRWASQVADFNARAGDVISRKIKRITWYKDPPRGEPGVYAAVDFTSQFFNIDIHCGYVVWRKLGDSFLVVREEEGMIDKKMEQKMQPAELERARRQIGC